jgi:hypothetical protein
MSPEQVERAIEFALTGRTRFVPDPPGCRMREVQASVQGQLAAWSEAAALAGWCLLF